MKITQNKHLIAIGLILLLGLFFHHDTLHQYPLNIHAWAQADRFALALNFLSNGFDLFNAETFLLNTEFPSNFKLQRESSVVAVNLPVHEFVIGGLMQILGTKSPIVFRLYVWLWSCIGLYFIFRLSSLLGLALKKQVILLIFALSSPVFIYYQDNFLPSAINLATSIIGVYYYVRYVHENRVKFFFVCALFLMLSAIYRTTALIPFISILSIEFLRILRKKGHPISFILILLLSAVPLYLLRAHSIHQIHHYGSVFLYYLVPATSFNQAIDILIYGIKTWFFDCISPPQLTLIVILVYMTIKSNPANQSDHTYSTLVSFIFISSIGYFAFWLAMLTKFNEHDYYFLDTFYLPLVILILVLLKNSSKPNEEARRKIFYPIVGILSICSLLWGYHVQEQRTALNAKESSVRINHFFEGSEHLLDQLEISKDAIILVIGPKLPNLPFIHLNRKGLILFKTDEEALENAMNWEFDYIISPNYYFNGYIAKQHKGLLNQLEVVYTNKNLSIYQLKGLRSISMN